jgi:hypothetical protein
MTRRPRGAKPQVKGAQGLNSRPHFESVQADTWWLHSHVSSQEYPMPESRWKLRGVLVGHVDGRPSVPHLQADSIKSVEAPLYLYIRIIMVECTHTKLFL